MLRKLATIISVIVVLQTTIPADTLAARKKPYHKRRHRKPVPRKVVAPPKTKVPVKRSRGDLNKDGVVNHKDRAVRNRILRQRSYVVAHDLNKDGVVDYRDKVIWVNGHPTVTKTIVITEAERQILEDIDINNDGQIDQTDIDVWFQNYDTNGDGEISEEEISSQ